MTIYKPESTSDMINRNYKSAFMAVPNGISFISVLMHRNSPITVMITMTTILLTHQETDVGTLPLYRQQIIK